MPVATLSNLFKLVILGFLITNTPWVYAASLWDSRKLLMDEQYESLEARFNEADQLVLNNAKEALPEYRFVYSSLMKPSDVGKNDFYNQLLAWQKKKPHSFAPLAALGKYHLAYGSLLRGSDYASYTSKQQFANMRIEHEKSESYFTEAIKRNPKAVSAYENLVSLDSSINTLVFDETTYKQPSLIRFLCSINFIKFFHKILGCRPVINRLFEASIFSNAPDNIRYSLDIWWAYLFDHTPRWGGSYEAMQAIVDDSKLYLSSKSVYTLEAMEIIDRMDILARNKKYTEAKKIGLKYLKKSEKLSITFDRHSAGLYYKLAYTYRKLKDFPTCIEYSKLATQIKPWYSLAWSEYGYCAMQAKQWEVAKKALSYHADTHDEVSSWAWFNLGKTSSKLDEYQLAYALFKKASRVNAKYEQYTQEYLKWLEIEHPDQASELKVDLSDIVGDLEYHAIEIES